VRKRRKVAQLAHEVRDWTSFVAQAERHGVAPLVYRHLRAAQVGLPDEAVRALQGLYLAHRHANLVRAQTLTQVLRELDAVGIEALVVKEGALCHLLYPGPALRPMSDLDLLLRRSDIEPARRVLRAPPPARRLGRRCWPIRALPEPLGCWPSASRWILTTEWRPSGGRCWMPCPMANCPEGASTPCSMASG